MSTEIDTNPTPELDSDAENQENESSYTSILPAAHIDKLIRKRFGGKRVSATTARYTSAGLEHIFAELARAAGEEAKKDKKKHIKIVHLMKATRSHPGMARFFRDYMFAPRARVDYQAIALLPPSERLAIRKQRMANKQKKKDSEVPAVDEE